jgi:hypothetical protein
MLTSTLAPATPRVSPSHQRNLDAGCRVTRTEVGNPSPVDGHHTVIHIYGRCAGCGEEMRDVTPDGFEDVRHSPYLATYYGPPDPTVCTGCAGRRQSGRQNAASRRAACVVCGKLSPGPGPDTYYCGCAGWD